MTRFAALLVAWNGESWIGDCLESLLAQQPIPDLFAVDNGSSDATLARLREAGGRFVAGGARAEVIASGTNLGFTAGANLALGAALGAGEADALLLLNQDAVLEPGTLAAFAGRFEADPRAAALGPRILDRDGRTIQHAGGRIEPPRFEGLHLGHHEPADSEEFRSPREVDYLTGAALALRAAALREVGLFDELFSPGYYEDADLCFRLRRAGWRVLYEPDASARHVESASFHDRDGRLALSERNRLLFAAKWMDSAGFGAAWLEAERKRLAGASADERRALASGAFQALLRLDRARGEGWSAGTSRRPALAALAAAFAAARREALDSLHEEALRAIDVAAKRAEI
jgi:GT2 family glycosyltransferase